MKVWIEKPISETPEKDGSYVLIHKSGATGRMRCDGGKWWDMCDSVTHYLVPIEVDHVLTDGELTSEDWAKAQLMLIDENKALKEQIKELISVIRDIKQSSLEG